MGSRRLVVDQETYDLVTKECKEEFLRHQTDIEGMKISQNFLVRRIARYYIER